SSRDLHSFPTRRSSDLVSLVRKVGVYNLNNIGDNGLDTTLDFVKINPTKYQVNIVNNGGPFVLSFAQAYEKGWIASYENKEIKRSEEHTSELQSRSDLV